MNKDKLAFWSQRAKKGDTAGSDDFILKELETREIVRLVKPGSKILDIGCGNGETLIKLAENKKCSGIGLDFCPSMVELANNNFKKKNLSLKLKAKVGSHPDPKIKEKNFDYVVTQRSLINLDSPAQQKTAFENIMPLLKKGGYYIMIESFSEGLEKTNSLRKSFSLPLIESPWHNVFLTEKEVRSWKSKNNKLIKIKHFSSSYYFLSRVIYAKLAALNQEALKYDSPINLLSLKIPSFGHFGPVRLCLWKRL